MEKNLFELASRQKYRFATRRGQVSVEDLWDLSLQELDESYKDYSGRVRAAGEDSLLEQPTKETESSANKRDLIVYVVRAKQAEAAAREEQHARRIKAARIRELLAQKQDAALADKSEEELQSLLREIDG